MYKEVCEIDVLFSSPKQVNRKIQLLGIQTPGLLVHSECQQVFRGSCILWYFIFSRRLEASSKPWYPILRILVQTGGVNLFESQYLPFSPANWVVCMHPLKVKIYTWWRDVFCVSRHFHFLKICLSCFIAVENTYSTCNLCKGLYYLSNNWNILIFKVKSCS